MPEQQRVVFLVRTRDGNYLRYVGGGWGPEYITTTDVMEAARFSTVQEAGARIRIGGWRGSTVVRATVTDCIEVN